MEFMIDPDRALELVLEHAPPQPAADVDAAEALGLTLAQDIRADRDYPPFDRAMMDGYAVRLADAGRAIPVVGEVAAGQLPKAPLTDGAAVAIMTGAPCPAGAQAVVPVEEVVVTGEQVQLPPELVSGRHIAPAGSECAAGEIVARAQQTITPLTIANLAAFGLTAVHAIPRPRCAVIVTGAELAPSDATPAAGRIRDSNGPMLAALAHAAGLTDVVRLRAGDTRDALNRALDEAAAADLVILTGGVSAGKYDIVPDVLAERGLEIVFHKVTQKPGKPLLFGRWEQRPVFGLPGNPLACHLGFHRYIKPAIEIMMGGWRPRPATAKGVMTQSTHATGPRTIFQLCRVAADADGWKIEPLIGKGSADIFSACVANAYLRLDPGEEAAKGAEREFTWVEQPR